MLKCNWHLWDLLKKKIISHISLCQDDDLAEGQADEDAIQEMMAEISTLEENRWAWRPERYRGGRHCVVDYWGPWPKYQYI